MFSWFKKAPTNPAPEYWPDYLSAVAEAKQGQGAATRRFVCFDTETTGLNPKEDRLLSIGAVAIQGEQIDLADSYECYVNWEMTKDKEKDTIPIHGILPTDSMDQIPATQAVAQFVEYIGGATLVGHHVAFDVAMVNQFLKTTYGLALKNPTLDTAQLARRLDGRHRGDFSPIPYDLDTLCQRFHIADHDRHNAAGDAFITAILFLKLRQRLAKRGVKI